MPLQNAMLVICIIAWVLCAIVFALVGRLVPHDIADLRQRMRERAEQEKAAQGA